MQTLYINADGYLFFDFPEGRPSAAALTIKTRDGADLPTAVSAVDIKSNFAIPSVDTTLAEAALQGAETVKVAATTSITPEYEFLIDGGTLIGELAKVKSVNPVTKVVALYRPLGWGHALGAAFQSHRLYYKVLAANNNSLYNQNVATVAAVVASVGLVKRSLYNVRYQKFLPTLTHTRLYNRLPDGEAWGFLRQHDFSEQLHEGLTMLKEDLAGFVNDGAPWGFDLDNLMEPSKAERAHLDAVLYLIADAWQQIDEGRLAALRLSAYRQSLEALVETPGWYERGDQDMQFDEDAGEGAQFAPVMRRA